MKDNQWWKYTDCKPMDDRGELDLTRQIEELKEEKDNTLDLSLLIDQHKKEIWNYKMKEAEWVKTNNQFEGTKRIVEELSKQVQELRRDNKYLAKQVQDYREILKKAGL